MDASTPDRIQLLDVQLSPSVTRVRLGLRDRTVDGTSHQRDQPRAAAQATLNALASVVPDAMVLRLDAIRVLPPADDVPMTLIVVVINVELAGTRLRHSGSALVADSPERAAAAAVLDALNRRMEIVGL